MQYTRFVEAHGTGTQVGDTVEANALGDAFKDHRSLVDPLYVGAVKTNIGHLEGASGIAGLIKAVLILKMGLIVPNTNFEQINNRIDADHLCLALPSICVPWPTAGLRRVSVNSFGFGGSNAHLILDDAFNYLRIRNLDGIHCTVPRPPKYLEQNRQVGNLWHQHYTSSPTWAQNGVARAFGTPKLLIFSASDKEGISCIVRQYQDHLSRALEEDIHNGAYIKNLAYTLDSCRSSLLWGSYVLLESYSGLKDLVARLSTPISVGASPPRLGYVFTGQGAQWHAVGRELLEYPAFLESVECAYSYLNELSCGWSVKGT